MEAYYHESVIQHTQAMLYSMLQSAPIRVFDVIPDYEEEEEELMGEPCVHVPREYYQYVEDVMYNAEVAQYETWHNLDVSAQTVTYEEMSPSLVDESFVGAKCWDLQPEVVPAKKDENMVSPTSDSGISGMSDDTYSPELLAVGEEDEDTPIWVDTLENLLQDYGIDIYKAWDDQPLDIRTQAINDMAHILVDIHNLTFWDALMCEDAARSLLCRAGGKRPTMKEIAAFEDRTYMFSPLPPAKPVPVQEEEVKKTIKKEPITPAEVSSKKRKRECFDDDELDYELLSEEEVSEYIDPQHIALQPDLTAEPGGIQFDAEQAELILKIMRTNDFLKRERKRLKKINMQLKNEAVLFLQTLETETGGHWVIDTDIHGSKKVVSCAA